MAVRLLSAGGQGPARCSASRWDTLAVWYTGTVAFRFFPWVTLMTQSILLVIQAEQRGQHLEMAALHEHAAASQEAAREILEMQHGWPKGDPGLRRVAPR